MCVVVKTFALEKCHLKELSLEKYASQNSLFIFGLKYRQCEEF